MPEEIIISSGNYTFTGSGGSDGWRPRSYVPLPISDGSAAGGSSGGGRCTDEAKKR
ncbi:hypothetical protein NEUTE1DRAFT_149663 [Neurospora tetrasperma FGSC 2508]|uniref:Uncharacterized protein n=1 Tax=Neurospora tetrasperma (strain FGSC 2508 / ATCC MYA-4615 / P0657) TaxID=510951 RepID=F8MZQ6_NEUT8|nr:uncharacterized protein NEUTE1DRAFT_149663 [Neurospora tetrasperma FGSC 2508]EGO52043.1 hypothetical protein NEUTE1DRAFT_149663 [Neurospora tetrasperma FGSC 2508]